MSRLQYFTKIDPCKLHLYRIEKVDTKKFLMVNNFLKWTIPVVAYSGAIYCDGKRAHYDSAPSPNFLSARRQGQNRQLQEVSSPAALGSLRTNEAAPTLRKEGLSALVLHLRRHRPRGVGTDELHHTGVRCLCRQNAGRQPYAIRRHPARLQRPSNQMDLDERLRTLQRKMSVRMR